MTRDEKFLKDARIEPCEIAESAWMAWRDDEVIDLRQALENWIAQTREQAQRAERWKLIAFGGWFALLAFALTEVWK